MEGLKWLDDLHRQPILLVPNLAYDHLVEPLQAALLLNGQHSIIPDLELIAVSFGELQLRFLLLVEALVVLVQRAARLLARDLLALLGYAVVAQSQRQQKLLEGIVTRI